MIQELNNIDFEQNKIVEKAQKRNSFHDHYRKIKETNLLNKNGGKQKKRGCSTRRGTRKYNQPTWKPIKTA